MSGCAVGSRGAGKAWVEANGVRIAYPVGVPDAHRCAPRQFAAVDASPSSALHARAATGTGLGSGGITCVRGDEAGKNEGRMRHG